MAGKAAEFNEDSSLLVKGKQNGSPRLSSLIEIQGFHHLKFDKRCGSGLCNFVNALLIDDSLLPLWEIKISSIKNKGIIETKRRIFEIHLLNSQ